MKSSKLWQSKLNCQSREKTACSRLENEECGRIKYKKIVANYKLLDTINYANSIQNQTYSDSMYVY